MEEQRAVEHERPSRCARVCAWAVGALLVVSLCVGGAAGCGKGGSEDDSGAGLDTGSGAGNIEAAIGAATPVGNATITVRAFQPAFQPVSPVQRLSEGTPAAPAAGESFYQAYVRVENGGQRPLRVDPEHFACRVGNVLSRIEPTRSGPMARSLIYGTSLDLVLTFRGPAGGEPVLIYGPPWYDGIITFSGDAAPAGTTTTTVVSGQ
jgi:hypothetical protein